ncbi:MAG: urate hydroxylase PuuD [Xanthomonadaceae bacterium]|nr:urate hydroxylase PuuD [Xanthomonadaceae bacterium]
MDLALFNIDGFLFLMRWLHVFFGIIWIGHLYYFNFTQGAYMAQADANAKSSVLQKLLPEALWWFRWGAMFTLITGLIYIGIRGHMGGVVMFATSWGACIMAGMTLGIIMFLNVWLVIWPNQKVVIANAVAVAAGQPANPAAAVSSGKALLASRTNTMFSIPMLFFMAGARHLPLRTDENSNFMMLTIAYAIIMGALELNAIKGKLGPLTKVGGVIHMGFILTIVMYVVMEVLL